MSKLFGYDRKSQDKYVDAQKLARDQAYVDSRKIEEAAGLIREQGPIFESAAGNVFAAGDEAAAIGRANASNILAETGEWARRRKGAQGAEQSFNRAAAAASGIRMDTGGSSDIFQDAVKSEHSKEIAWGWKAGRSQADIATREGERARLEAYSAGEGILAGIPGLMSQANLYETDASSLRSSADIAVAEARANRASARSSSYSTGIATAIAIVATYGAASGAVAAGGAAAGAGVFGTGLTAGQLALGTIAVGGGLYALNSILSSGDNVTAEGLAGTQGPQTPVIPGVTTGKGFDTSAAPDARPFIAPFKQQSEAATATSKKQILASTNKTNKTDVNIFGASASPLAAVGV